MADGLEMAFETRGEEEIPHVVLAISYQNRRMNRKIIGVLKLIVYR